MDQDTKKALALTARALMEKQTGDTYFRAGGHYHRLVVLNYCVRDGNRCDHYDMVAGKTTPGGKAERSCLACDADG